MNWKPIKDAPLDGTCVDLWISSANHRLTDCTFQDGRWKKYNHAQGKWQPISTNPTHFMLEEPPQEPLSWPTEDGWWWVKTSEGINCHRLALLPLDRNANRVLSCNGWHVDESAAEGWQFIRATPPIFPITEK